ncbi:UDP-glycosyltransferase UGT4-like [Zophobas morio]|uniref:UDP-glycosyltransferase UGT4-like n=1 Tax=Zophobas morio TaxID=2755281 RepID=UPI0030827863
MDPEVDCKNSPNTNILIQSIENTLNQELIQEKEIRSTEEHIIPATILDTVKEFRKFVIFWTTSQVLDWKRSFGGRNSLLPQLIFLGVSLFPTYSHQKVFHPIWYELSLRGHEVTVCTTFPLNDPNLTNLTEIDISFQHDNTQHAPPDFLSKEINMFQDFHNIVNYFDFIAETALNHPRFKNFLETRAENFDLIILECFYPVLYGLSRKFQAPTVCVSSFGALTVFQDVVGNPSHPTLYREFFVTLHHLDLDLWHKSELFLLNLWSRFWYEFVVLARGAVLAKSVFGYDIGDTLDGKKSVKLLLLNVNRVVYDPRPNVPAVLELGLMGLKSKETLTEDLQTFLDEAKSGVVYFSLGTMVHLEGSLIGRTILEGLARVPYKVIIKWNCSSLIHNYTNILCREWLPQIQILEHPNLKVFVTQGGLQSLEESISAGTNQ